MTDTILIVGAGLAGLVAARQCTRAGARALVLETGPVAGGHLAASMAAPENASLLPALADIAADDMIELVPLARLDKLEGRPGNFTAGYEQHARFVTDACTRCNHCRAACPSVVSNEFDAGLTYRKAIHTPLPESLPEAYVIDIESCLNSPPNYLPCDRCAQVCDDDAVDFEMPVSVRRERIVGAVIVATGFELAPDDALAGLGYGGHPDIVTSAELQRMLQSPGPSGGFAIRPSDESYPQSALLVLDDLSEFGLYIVASQAQKLLAQGVARVDALLLSAPANEDRVAAMAGEAGFGVHWGGMFRVAPEKGGAPLVGFEDFVAHRPVSQEYDMVVLCGDPQPASGLASLAGVLDCRLDDRGYVAHSDGAASRDGVYVAGCAGGPARIEETVKQARRAAAAALADLNPRLLREEYDASADTGARQVADEDPELERRIERMLNTLLDAR